MGNDAHLKIKSQIQPEIGEFLKEACLDWSFQKSLDLDKLSASQKRVHEFMEPFLFMVASDPEFHAELEKGRFDLDVEFTITPEIYEYFFEEFIPKYAVSVDLLSYRDTYTNGEETFKWDSEKRLLIQSKGSEPNEEDFDSQLDSGQGHSPDRSSEWSGVLEWRQALSGVIEFVADREKQKKVFDKQHEDHQLEYILNVYIESYADLRDLYLEIMSEHEKHEKLLGKGLFSKKELNLLSPFDQNFGLFYPEDEDDFESIINHTEWIQLSEIALELKQKLVPFLDEL